jgi:ABC-type Mn2+/Zn2+ transport system permease subunit
MNAIFYIIIILLIFVMIGLIIAGSITKNKKYYAYTSIPITIAVLIAVGIYYVEKNKEDVSIRAKEGFAAMERSFRGDY